MVALAGVLVTGVVTGRPRPYVQAGLILTGVVTLVALPFALGKGRTADLPSALPLNYGRGLTITVGVIWLAVGLVAIVRERPRHRRRRMVGDRPGIAVGRRPDRA